MYARAQLELITWVRLLGDASKKYFHTEVHPDLKHDKIGLVGMCADTMHMNASAVSSL